MADNLPQLLSVEDYGGNLNGEQIAETWLVNWSSVYPTYNLDYPVIGAYHNTINNLQCTEIKINPEKSYYNGNETAALKAVFKLDYNLEPDIFSVRTSSGGYRSFKIYAGGTWAGTGLKDTKEQGELEYKIPVVNISASTRIMGEINYITYESRVGTINNNIFWGRLPGTVLFESYNIIPKVVNGVVIETELVLNFQVCSLDWNYEYRNPQQFINPRDGRPAYWQNAYSDRFDYTENNLKVGLPIWSGEISGYGNPILGVGGWDYRMFNMSYYDNVSGTWSSVVRCAYAYTDFSDIVGV